MIYPPGNMGGRDARPAQDKTTSNYDGAALDGTSARGLRSTLTPQRGLRGRREREDMVGVRTWLACDVAGVLFVASFVTVLPCERPRCETPILVIF